MVGAAGGLPAEALGGPPSRCALRWTAFACTQSEGWAHFEFTRINMTPTILCKKIEDLRQLGAFHSHLVAQCLPIRPKAPTRRVPMGVLLQALRGAG